MNGKRSKFTWGEAVSVMKNAPSSYRPGEFASICGIDKITTQKEADELLCKNGEWIYIIEYEDGSSIEIPESYLEKYENKTDINGVDSKNRDEP